MEKNIVTDEQKNERIKVYADKLERDMRNTRFVQIVVSTALMILIAVIVYLSSKGNVVVVGENLYAHGQGGYSMNNKEVVVIRADGHARLLYDRFFSFDYNNIKEQKSKSVYLGDKSIEKLYVSLTRIGFYKEVAENFYTVKSYADTIKVVSITSTDATVRVSGRMVLTNNAYFEERKLDLNLVLRPIAPIKDLNPFGFSIINLELISNDVLLTKAVE